MQPKATDYLIKSIERATMNGRKVKIFEVYRRGKNCRFFVGKFKAPASTPNRDLWEVLGGDV